MRVTLTKRRCPQCGKDITPEEIDRQEEERRRLEEERRRLFEEERRRQQLLVFLVCLCLIVVAVVIWVVKLTEERPQAVPVAPPPGTKAPVDRHPPQPREGVLILTTKVPIIKGAEAWVEVDEKRVAEWKVGTTELHLTLTAGTYRVAVYSIYRKMRRTIFDKEITVPPDATSTVDVGP